MHAWLGGSNTFHLENMTLIVYRASWAGAENSPFHENPRTYLLITADSCIWWLARGIMSVSEPYRAAVKERGL